MGRGCSTLRRRYPDLAVKLQMKFRENAPASLRQQLISELEGMRSVREVRPLFPDVTDAELGAMYVVELRDSRGRRLLKDLNSRDAVEFAEPEAKRRLAASG